MGFFAIPIFLACIWGGTFWLRSEALKDITTKEQDDA